MKLLTTRHHRLLTTVFIALLTCNYLVVGQGSIENRVNINTASIEELMQLPGIGQKLAERIIAHRDKHGAFKRPQDIIIVRGMSARRYRQIAHLIRT